MNNTPIFIPYETKVREFDGRLLLISYLLKNDFSNVFFGSRGSIKKHSLRFKKGLIILKSLSVEEEQFYVKLKIRGFKLALLHAEGGIHYKKNKSSIESLYNPQVLKYVDINFVYGEQVKSDILKYCGNHFKDSIVVSGEPRFDLLKAKYNLFYKETINKLNNDYPHGFVLINTSFSAGNPVVGIKNLTNYFLEEPTFTNETRELLLKKSEFMQEIVCDYIKMITEIAHYFPQKHFVIRPHPSESMDVYLTAFKKINNVHIIKDGNVHEWIFASDCVIHYDCTTGMEAKIASKPVISYIPKIDYDIVAWLPIELSKKTHSVEELIDILKTIFSNKYKDSISEELKTIWVKNIFNVENDSCEIIVKHIIQLDLKGYKNIPLNKVRSFLWGKYSAIKEDIFNLIRVRKMSISHVKFGVLNLAEVDIKLKRFYNIINNDKHIKFKLNKVNNELINIKIDSIDY